MRVLLLWLMSVTEWGVAPRPAPIAAAPTPVADAGRVGARQHRRGGPPRRLAHPLEASLRPRRRLNTAIERRREVGHRAARLQRVRNYSADGCEQILDAMVEFPHAIQVDVPRPARLCPRALAANASATDRPVRASAVCVSDEGRDLRSGTTAPPTCLEVD